MHVYYEWLHVEGRTRRHDCTSLFPSAANLATPRRSKLCRFSGAPSQSILPNYKACHFTLRYTCTLKNATFAPKSAHSSIFYQTSLLSDSVRVLGAFSQNCYRMNLIEAPLCIFLLSPVMQGLHEAAPFAAKSV